MKIIKAHKIVLNILNKRNNYNTTNDMMVDVVIELRKIKIIKERRNKLKMLNSL